MSHIYEFSNFDTVALARERDQLVKSDVAMEKLAAEIFVTMVGQQKLGPNAMAEASINYAKTFIAVLEKNLNEQTRS